MSETEKPQPDKFRDLARQLECDDDVAKFEDQVQKVAVAGKRPTPDTTTAAKRRL